MKNVLAKIGQFFVKTEAFWKRLGLSVLTLLITTFLSFILIKSMPGDIIQSYAMELAAQRNISVEEATKLAVTYLNYDPDESILSAFFRYFNGLLHGNLGSSMYIADLTANDIIKQCLPWTLFVSTFSLLLAFLIGCLLGGRMAWKRKGASEVISSAVVVATNSMPDYLVGIMLFILFANKLRWFPSSGAYDIMVAKPGFNLAFFGSCLYHAFLPICSCVIASFGSWALNMKGSAVGVLGEDYINAARARGLPDTIIKRKYLRKNAMLPLVTSLALSFAGLFGGSSVLESVFNYPGIGQQYAICIGRRDYFVVEGILFFLAFIVIVVNFLTDSIYSLIDPRIRRS